MNQRETRTHPEGSGFEIIYLRIKSSPTAFSTNSLINSLMHKDDGVCDGPYHEKEVNCDSLHDLPGKKNYQVNKESILKPLELRPPKTIANGNRHKPLEE